MPDSQQPPLWGPPYQPADLDALLSGDRRSTPEALRPVGRTLDALRAAPAPGGRELADEAAARAAFRALVRPQSQQAAAGWTAWAEPEAVAADTLVLPSAEPSPSPVLPLAERVLAPADGHPPGRARHRRRRHPGRAVRRPVVALSGAAVAAVVVVAVAVTGAIPGSFGRVGSGGRTASPSSSATGSGHTAGALEGQGTRGTIAKPTPTPTPSISSAPLVSPSATSGTGTLCREFFEPTAEQSRATRHTLFGELAKAAGSQDMGQVFGYCFHYLSSTWSRAPHSHRATSPGGHPGGVNRGSGNTSGSDPGSGHSGAGTFGPGNSGPGNSATPEPSTGASGHVSAGATANASATARVGQRQPDAAQVGARHR